MREKKYFMKVIVLAVLATACGPKTITKVEVIREKELEILEVPANNWGVNYRFFNRTEMNDEIGQYGDAVVHILDSADQASGSGFFISEDGIMVTAAHVIPRARCWEDSCRGIIAVRDSRVGGANEVFTKIEPILIDETADVGIYRLGHASGQAVKGLPNLKISMEKLAYGKTHWLIGHPKGGSLKFSEYKPEVAGGFKVRGGGAMIFGNSGGPIIDPDTGEVVGIAHAIEQKISTIRTDGNFRSYAYMITSAYLPIAIAFLLGDLDKCGVLPADRKLGISDGILAIEKCGKKPGSRSLTLSLASLLPREKSQKRLFKNLHESTEFKLHYSWERTPQKYWDSSARQDPATMYGVVDIYRRASTFLGFWLLQSPSYLEVENSYVALQSNISASPPNSFFGMSFGPLSELGFSFSLPTERVAPKLDSPKDCAAKIKPSSDPLFPLRAQLLNCKYLPVELAKDNRDEFMTSLQRSASASDASTLLAHLGLLELYLKNEGDPLGDEELSEILQAIRVASDQDRDLARFMALDQQFYRLQHPEIFGSPEADRDSWQKF